MWVYQGMILGWCDSGIIVLGGDRPMQHNYLSNFLLYYTTLDRHEWFRAASYLETMPVIRLLDKKLRYRRYESRKQTKTAVNSKERAARQDFDIVVLEDGEFAFLSNRQKSGLVGNPEGSITIAQPGFVQKLIGPGFLGEKVLVEEKQVILYGLHWQNYLIFSSQVSNGQVLLFIQQINAATVTRRLVEPYAQFTKRIRTFFEPVLSELFSARKAEELLQLYLPEIRKVIQKHPETVKQVDKDRDEVDYTLILYYALSGVLKMV